MKKDTKSSKPAEIENLDDDEELTEREKIMYQMIWGKNWDEEYPSERTKK